MRSLSARPTPRTGRTIPAGLGGSRRNVGNDARPDARAHASSARWSRRRHGRRVGRGGLGAPGELSVSEKVSLSAKLSVRRDGVPRSSSKVAVVAPRSSSKDAVDDDAVAPRPATSATGAGVGACQACTNAAAAASCPGVCATGRIFVAAGVEAPITVTRLFAARASRTTTFAARRSPPRRTIPMRAGGAAAVPQRRAMAFGNIPTRRCTRNPSAGRRANRLPIASRRALRELHIPPAWHVRRVKPAHGRFHLRPELLPCRFPPGIAARGSRLAAVVVRVPRGYDL